MSAVPFASVPDSARLWVFGAARPLSGEEREAVAAEVDRFLAGWHAHGHPVVGASELRYDRFLFVAADERATGVSGCSIDSLFRQLKSLEGDLGASLLDSSLVWFRDESGDIRAEPRPAFRERAKAGEVGPDTVVFDNTVATVGEMRGGRWEVAARESWHARLL